MKRHVLLAAALVLAGAGYSTYAIPHLNVTFNQQPNSTLVLNMDIDSVDLPADTLWVDLRIQGDPEDFQANHNPEVFLHDSNFHLFSYGLWDVGDHTITMTVHTPSGSFDVLDKLTVGPHPSPDTGSTMLLGSLSLAGLAAARKAIKA